MKRFLLAAALAAALAGCGPGLPPTVKVGGTVTLDTKPLPEGQIVFYPADKEGAAPSSAPIVDGKYLIGAVPKGTYRVAFRSDKTSAAPAGGMVSSDFNAPSAAAKKDPIPKKYHTPSLPADVSADNPALNFDLTSR